MTGDNEKQNEIDALRAENERISRENAALRKEIEDLENELDNFSRGGKMKKRSRFSEED